MAMVSVGGPPPGIGPCLVLGAERLEFAADADPVRHEPRRHRTISEPFHRRARDRALGHGRGRSQCGLRHNAGEHCVT